jgi:broad specificity polyphosphatase/5'/3'-nucleotidase SurE
VDGIEPDTDIAAVRDGAISLTPLLLDHTHTQSMQHLEQWLKVLEPLTK